MSASEGENLSCHQKARQPAIAEYAAIFEATLQRAKGWAILFETVLVDNPRNPVMGERILRRVVEDTELRAADVLESDVRCHL